MIWSDHIPATKQKRTQMQFLLRHTVYVYIYAKKVYSFTIRHYLKSTQNESVGYFFLCFFFNAFDWTCHDYE